MKQNKKEVHFVKSVKNSHLRPNQSSNYNKRREQAKLKIADKFNMSLDEAEIILKRYEKNKKEINSLNDGNIKNNELDNISDNIKFRSDDDNLDIAVNNNLKKSFKKNDTNDEEGAKFGSTKKLLDYDENVDKIQEKINILASERTFNHDEEKIKNFQNSFNIPINDKSLSSKSHENVDSIISDIIPDYNKQISIKVEHINLTFEVQKEKVDTLKENFIRMLHMDNPEKLKINVLNDVTFNVYKGEKVGIIGYNGAGKSTLLNVITGIYPPDTGKVTTFGNISPLLALGAGFDPNFSGRRNIFLNGAILGYDKQFLESKLNEIIDFSGLGEFIDIPIKNYSSGMLSKLAFSIATAVNPDILIIDEILGVGDATFSKKSSDKIHSLMDGGTTVILVSHSIPQIRSLCDKAIWIDKGCVREMGEVNKVCDHYLKDAEKASNEQLANIQFK